MKSLLIAVVSLVFLSVGAQAKTATSKKPAETKPAAHCTKAEDHAGHAHGADCGCPKVEAHGHTHYEHKDATGKVHHHVEHDGHYDECDKPHGA
ncbi:MAG: hypothetical protein ACKN9V_00910 [Pseudomonadota bacterium]